MVSANNGQTRRQVAENADKTRLLLKQINLPTALPRCLVSAYLRFKARSPRQTRKYVGDNIQGTIRGGASDPEMCDHSGFFQTIAAACIRDLMIYLHLTQVES